MDFNGVYNEARPLKWSRLLFPDYWQWTTAKIPKIILRNIQVSARNCFKEQRHGFLLTFDWCRGQMMLISLKRNMAWCIVKWYNGQSMQLLLTNQPISGLSRPHVCNLRDGCDDANWWPAHVPAFSSSFQPITCALLRPFHEHICTVNNATSCGGRNYLIIRND